jgi:3-deoxy-manno-octulosonate cytidylyltransferase (CMP-KDO synthetase)
VRAAGGDAIVTAPNLPSGSDRVAEALKLRDPQGRYSHVVNLQGDLPTIDPLSVQPLPRRPHQRKRGHLHCRRPDQR